MEEYLTLEEVAERLRLKVRTLRYWVYDATSFRLKPVLKNTSHGQGGRILFNPADVERLRQHLDERDKRGNL